MDEINQNEDNFQIHEISPTCRTAIQRTICLVQTCPDLLTCLKNEYSDKISSFKEWFVCLCQDIRIIWQLQWVRRKYRKSAYYIHFKTAVAFCHPHIAPNFPSRLMAYLVAWSQLNDLSVPIGENLAQCGVTGLERAFLSVVQMLVDKRAVLFDRGHRVKSLMEFFEPQDSDLDWKRFDEVQGHVLSDYAARVLTLFVTLPPDEAKSISLAYKMIYQCATDEQRQWMEETFPICFVMPDLPEIGKKCLRLFNKYCDALIDHHTRANDKEGVRAWTLAKHSLMELESLVGSGDMWAVRRLADAFVIHVKEAGAYTYASRQIHPEANPGTDAWADLVRGKRAFWIRFWPDGTEFYDETSASEGASRKDPNHYYDIPYLSGVVREVLAFYFNAFKKHMDPVCYQNERWNVTPEMAAKVPFLAFPDKKTWDSFKKEIERLPGLRNIIANGFLEPEDKTQDKTGRIQNKGRRYRIFPWPHRTDIPRHPPSMEDGDEK